ncbi:MAG: hypothetical protein WBH04_17800 [Albidovulum sp.]
MNSRAPSLILARRSLPDSGGVRGGAVLGALLPDLSLFLMVGWALCVQNVSANTPFDSSYFSDQFRVIFAVDNYLPFGERCS